MIPKTTQSLLKDFLWNIIQKKFQFSPSFSEEKTRFIAFPQTVLIPKTKKTVKKKGVSPKTYYTLYIPIY